MSPAFFRQAAGLFVAGIVIGASALLALPSVSPPPQRASPPPMTAVRTQSCGEDVSIAASAECRSIIEARRQRHDDWVAAIDAGDEAKDKPDLAAPSGGTSDKVAAPSSAGKPAGNVAQDAAAHPAAAQKTPGAKPGAAAKRRLDRERAREAREAREARAQAQRHEWARPSSRARRPDQRRSEPRFEPYNNF